MIYGLTMCLQVLEVSEGQAISPKQSLKRQGKEDQRGSGGSNQGGEELCGGKKKLHRKYRAGQNSGEPSK